MKSIRSIAKNRKGQAMTGFVIGMATFLGLGAGAVDIGRHAYTATQLQNLADAAASAAAKSAGTIGCTVTSGGFCASDKNAAAYSAAQVLAQNNSVNGQVLGFASSDVRVGHFASGAFTAGQDPNDAVRVTARITLTNILAGVIGRPTSTIERSAVAAIVALGGGIPTLPMALGEDYWANCITYGCPQPTIILVPSPTQDAGWTTFFSPANSSNLHGYFPSPCGNGVTRPFISVGDYINLSNGQNQTLFDDIWCLVCQQGHNAFLVPVVQEPNGQFNQAALVVGFATAVVDSFNWNQGRTPRSCSDSRNGGNPISINVRSVFNANTPGPPGPGFYGSGYAQVLG